MIVGSFPRLSLNSPRDHETARRAGHHQAAKYRSNQGIYLGIPPAACECERGRPLGSWQGSGTGLVRR